MTTVMTGAPADAVNATVLIWTSRGRASDPSWRDVNVVPGTLDEREGDLIRPGWSGR